MLASPEKILFTPLLAACVANGCSSAKAAVHWNAGRDDSQLNFSGARADAPLCSAEENPA